MKQYDLVAHLYRQRAFSRATFGPNQNVAGVTDHIRKELVEIEEAQTEGDQLGEWVDVILLALDGAWRTGTSPEQIAERLELKQTINELRKWPDWRTHDPSKAVEHIRS